MGRRIAAWIVLAGFVLLLLNLIVFRVYWQLSMVIYVIIMISYVLLSRKGSGYKAGNASENASDREKAKDDNESSSSEGIDGSKPGNE